MKENFSQYLSRKYIEWRGNVIGRSRSQSAFAAYIGMPQSTVAEYLNGRNVPEKAHVIEKFVMLWGYEVYDVLGLPRPDTDERYTQLKSALDKVPPELTEELAAVILEFLRENGVDVRVK